MSHHLKTINLMSLDSKLLPKKDCELKNNFAIPHPKKQFPIKRIFKFSLIC